MISARKAGEFASAFINASRESVEFMYEIRLTGFPVVMGLEAGL